MAGEHSRIRTTIKGRPHPGNVMKLRLSLLAVLPLVAGCALGLTSYSKDSADTGLPGSTGGGSGGDSGDPGGSSGNGSGSDGSDCVDEDGDGIDTCDGDCDDGDPATHPGAAENDSTTACMRDADGDGWGDDSASGPITPGTDCDDTTLALQQDDTDGDGVSTCDGDCDDQDSSRAPGLSETPFDGVDSDCDGEDGGSIINASGTGGLPFTDYTTTTSTASVSGCGTVQSLQVTVDITHTWQGDLSLELLGPSGLGVTLHDRTGGSADNIIGTYADSGGTLIPVDPLTTFEGSNGDGTWTLDARDNAAGDTGTLNSWSLTLYCSG